MQSKSVALEFDKISFCELELLSSFGSFKTGLFNAANEFTFLENLRKF